MSLVSFAEAALLPTLWAGTAFYFVYLAIRWRKLLLSPDVGSATWGFGMALICIGVVSFLYFVSALVVFGQPWSAGLSIPLVLLGLMGWSVVAQPLTVVRSDPPEVAVLTFWTGRLKIPLPEGEYLLLTFFPFKLGVSPATAKALPLDFLFENVPCKSDTGEPGKPGVGAFVNVRVVGSIEVDHMMSDSDIRGTTANAIEGARRIINFQNRGGNDGLKDGNVVDWEKNGVLKVLHGVIGEGLREHAKGYTWEEYMALKAPLAATLVANISTARPRQLPVNSEGIVVKPDHATFTYEQYEACPIINEPLAYVCAAIGSDDDEERKKRYRNRIVEMEFFLEMIREGGFADIPDLGIQLTRFTVPEIEPIDEVKTAANKAAAEKKQREQEIADTKAELALAQLYIDGSPEPKPTMNEALAFVRLRRNPGTQEIFIRGSSSSLTDAAAIVAAGKTQGVKDVV